PDEDGHRLHRASICSGHGAWIVAPILRRSLGASFPEPTVPRRPCHPRPSDATFRSPAPATLAPRPVARIRLLVAGAACLLAVTGCGASGTPDVRVSDAQAAVPVAGS